jgi:hypothetical protein
MASDTPDDKLQDEKRMAPRRRVLKAGVVAFNNRFSTLPCTVRDLSAAGARLRIEGSLDAPDTFELIIELDGLEANCEVVSRKAKEVGVRFVSPPRITAPRRTQVIKAHVPAQPPSLRRKPKPDTAS